MAQQISEAKAEAPVPRALRDIDKGLQALTTELEGLADRLKPVRLEKGPLVLQEASSERARASPLEENLLAVEHQIGMITAEVCRLRAELQI